MDKVETIVIDVSELQRSQTCWVRTYFGLSVVQRVVSRFSSSQDNTRSHRYVCVRACVRSLGVVVKCTSTGNWYDMV
jgi:hypothetical protein